MSVMSLDHESWVVLVGPQERFASDAFAKFGSAIDAAERGEPQPSGRAAADLPRSVVSFAGRGIGAPASRGSMRPGALLRRPVSA
jgi:hypothetical protein